MKFLVIMLGFVLLTISACSNVPADLYDCESDQDCELMNKNLITKECCEWDSINNQYRDWYQKQTDQKVICTHTCPMSLHVEAVCVNNKCNIGEEKT